MNSVNRYFRQGGLAEASTARHSGQAYRLLTACMLVAMLLAPTAALAQDPGTTVPAAPTEEASASSAEVDAILSAPIAPAGYSGGSLGVDDVEESVLSGPIDVSAVEYDAESVETIPTIDSSMISAPFIGPLTQEGTSKSYLPLMQFDHNENVVPKLGFGAGAKNITSYQDIRRLNAGWYVNWKVTVHPARPGMEFVQMVRLHQDIDVTKVYNAATGQMCGISVTADRTICPYAVPAKYSYGPNAATIQSAAKANLGSIWLIGNEMERVDWSGGRQDEIVPELYAVAFHDIRAIIKAADPTARIAIGGIIQFTPLRQAWLDKVWSTYQTKYGHPIDNDIDVFNVHNFIGSERCDQRMVNGQMERVCTGMGVPAGIPPLSLVNGIELGSYVGQDNRHMDMSTFSEQILGFRSWMKAKNANNINKPLIVTEYGALYADLCTPHNEKTCVDYYTVTMPWGYHDYTDPAVVQTFMTDTFNYFNAASDCNLSSQAAFGCKLVQRWAWFGLEDVGWGFNKNGALIDLTTGKLTSTGELFSSWALSQ